MKPSLTLLVAMLVAGGAQASDVFKTTDSAGRPVYTDRPTTLPAQRVDVRTQATDEVAVQQRYDEQMKSYAAQDKTRADQAANATDAARSKDLSEAAKARRCEEARQRYESYMIAQRLYEPGATEDERRYLTDAEIDDARAKAQQLMNEFCNEG
jgi:Domain of unknown function (DUF4124)